MSKYRQGDHLTFSQRDRWSRPLLLSGKARLAIIIGHDVQCSQESIQINHQLAPFWFCLDKLTVRAGYLSFQVLSISHQTFEQVVKGEIPLDSYGSPGGERGIPSGDLVM